MIFMIIAKNATNLWLLSSANFCISYENSKEEHSILLTNWKISSGNLCLSWLEGRKWPEGRCFLCFFHVTLLVPPRRTPTRLCFAAAHMGWLTILPHQFCHLKKKASGYTTTLWTAVFGPEVNFQPWALQKRSCTPRSGSRDLLPGLSLF